MLRLYSIYHLNLAYSSIPESKRKEVIDRCFWPLLDLAITDRIPISIEAPAYTLEVADALDSSWIASLKRSIQEGKVEFIGAGYSQLIAPLVPNRVNVWNLKIGESIYRDLLASVPAVWYVNEQAYSAGIVGHYTNINAKAIVMEWNNPRSLHPEWKGEFRYYPQIAVGTDDKRIPVIWNDSISFQKFQRVAHGDLDKSEFCAYLLAQCGEEDRNFCLYGNDAEIFDFRPGRFKAEPEINEESEWLKIKELYRLLSNDERFKLVFPSEVLQASEHPLSYSSLSLESPAQPIPVKKQPKYNITRWALTGRNTVTINSTCYQIYQKLDSLQTRGVLTQEKLASYWKTLCYLWASDFRTHITSERWDNYLIEITRVLEELSKFDHNHKSEPAREAVSVNGLCGTVFLARKGREQILADAESGAGPAVSRNERFLRISTSAVDVILNRKRGMAIDSLTFPAINNKPLIGTISHGYFNDIALGADWYSSNTVLQRPGKQQITDLSRVTIQVVEGNNDIGEFVQCTSSVPTEIGPIAKVITIYKNIPQIDCSFDFLWEKIPLGSFKTGTVTLFPDSFDMKSLFYATHNGGSALEVYNMFGSVVSHDTPGSSIVTASHGLGATEGILVMGDSEKGIAIWFNQTECAAMPMILFRQAAPSFFTRILFSCGEMDESKVQPSQGPIRFSFSLTGMSKINRHVM